MKSFSHGYGQNTYHLIWCTKCRYKVLRRDDIKSACMKAIHDVANCHGIVIRELVVDDDHAHAEVDLPPTMSVSQAFQLLKGGTAYRLFMQFPYLRLRYRRGHLWSIGKIFRSVSEVSQEKVENYIRSHRNYQSQLTRYSWLAERMSFLAKLAVSVYSIP